MSGEQSDVASANEKLAAADNSQDKFAQLLDSLPTGMYTCDEQGRLTYCNAAAKSLFGREPAMLSDAEKFCGAHKILDLQDQIVPSGNSFMAHVVQGTTNLSSVELVFVKPGGEQIDVLINASSLRSADGKIHSFVFTLTDLTESNKSNAQFLNLLDAISPTTGQDFFQALVKNICSTFDIDYVFVGEVDTNDAGMMHTLAIAHKGELIQEFTYSLHGTPCEKVVEKQICYYECSVTDLFPEDVLLQGMNVESYLGIRLVSATNDAIGIIALMHNKTLDNPHQLQSMMQLIAVRAAAEIERKQIEEQQQVLQEQLQQGRNLESLSVLTGGIAHDFNNLLASIIGNAGLALRKLEADAPARNLIVKIEKAAERSAELTQQMLAYSGRSIMARKPVSLDAIAKKAISAIGSNHNPSAEIDLDLGICSVRGDESHLVQLVSTLVENALDALDKTPGKISVRTGEKSMSEVELQSPYCPMTFTAGIYSFLEISDSGKGMSPEILSRLFDPFFSTKFTGRGLGLAAALGIVRSHRGSIHVSSEPGRGSVFKVYLPKVEPVQPQVEQDEEKSIAPSDLKTVLVIDDEPDMRELVKNILHDASYEAITASSGKEGLQLFEENKDRISAVLLDMVMPGMNGLEVLRELKKIAPTIPVIIMSGYSEVEIKSKYEDYGAADYLEKPFKPDDLDRHIMKVVNGKR